MKPVTGRKFFLLFGALLFAPLLAFFLAALSVKYKFWSGIELATGLIFYGSMALGLPGIQVGAFVALVLAAAQRIGFVVRSSVAASLTFMAVLLLAWHFSEYSRSVADLAVFIPYAISAALIGTLVYRMYPPEVVIPARQIHLAGSHALVDGIPFKMPINSEQSPALMAVFSIDADAAQRLMPGSEVHPLRLWKRGLLVLTVIDYRITDIGTYIEYSIAIACTHGRKPAPRLLPGLLMKTFGTGQYVWDLPVSTEVSVKGGKGIWGMPKHQAHLDFVVGEHWVSSQYDLDGQMLMRIDVERPTSAWLPVNMGAANYCAFRGMLMKSYIYFKGKLGFSLFKKGSARLLLGDHPRIAPLKTLDIDPVPIASGFFPSTVGVLDDYFECWFLTEATPPARSMQGLETTHPLAQSQDWLAPPQRAADWEK